MGTFLYSSRLFQKISYFDLLNMTSSSLSGSTELTAEVLRADGLSLSNGSSYLSASSKSLVISPALLLSFECSSFFELSLCLPDIAGTSASVSVDFLISSVATGFSSSSLSEFLWFVLCPFLSLTTAPSLSSIILLLRRLTISVSCVAIITVVPFSLISTSSLTISHDVASSKFPVGSSANKISGERIRALAIAAL